MHDPRAARPPSGPEYVGPLGTTLLGVGLLAAGVLLVGLLVTIWPAVEQSTRPQVGPVAVRVLGSAWRITLSADTALLVLVIVTSALGGFVHAATSFSTFVGNRRLARSWTWWYLLRIISGVALAVLFYFVFRGGLLSAQASPDTIDPYGVGALAALVGLFSKQATDKLREVFETMFRTAAGYGDDERKDKLINPRPRAIAVEPPRVPAGSGATELSVRGQGFLPTSVVQLNRPGPSPVVVVPRSMEYAGPTEIKIGLVAEDLVHVGRMELTVVNPEPGGGRSEPVLLEIHEPS